MLITQIVIATFIFHALHQLTWLDVNMFKEVPKTIIIGLFTLFIFLLDDLTKYFVHRWMHKYPILWALHKVHHSATELTPLTIYRTHPLEGIVFSLRSAFTQGLAISVFFFLFGDKVSLATVLGVNVMIFLFNVAGSNLRHSHIGIRYWRWLEYILISPAQHQLHHSIAKEHHDKNFGATLAIWDWVFKSHHYSTDTEKLTLGLNENQTSKEHSLYTIYVSPVVEVIEIIRTNFISSYKNTKRMVYRFLKIKRQINKKLTSQCKDNTDVKI
jgi:sterol desaturase/sphingolipid hydroxylase (fatty acid hydroxylase superfamily)